MFKSKLSPMEQRVKAALASSPKESILRLRKRQDLFDNSDAIRLADQPDDYVLYLGTELVDEPGAVKVATTEEFEELLYASSKVAKLRYSEEHIQDVIRHETSHAEVITGLGLTAILGISFNRTTFLLDTIGVGRQEFCQPVYKSSLTKLQVGAVVARPIDPSPNDLSTLDMMNYTVPIVGDKIDAYNQANPEQPLPMPLSLQ